MWWRESLACVFPIFFFFFFPLPVDQKQHSPALLPSPPSGNFSAVVLRRLSPFFGVDFDVRAAALLLSFFAASWHTQKKPVHCVSDFSLFPE